ncbi:hypothetical protein ZIOFF_013752 [Zingiber officinale]|uniref:X8 domain-containing protein n=1 Tax=Zingiber officinale TaxID=94328 RepID=A0A8J5HCA7_ZINOF|nr:hypothetical protein ZIOFF_013752 [Zingiber officinale]
MRVGHSTSCRPHLGLDFDFSVSKVVTLLPDLSFSCRPQVPTSRSVSSLLEVSSVSSGFFVVQDDAFSRFQLYLIISASVGRQKISELNQWQVVHKEERLLISAEMAIDNPSATIQVTRPSQSSFSSSSENMAPLHVSAASVNGDGYDNKKQLEQSSEGEKKESAGAPSENRILKKKKSKKEKSSKEQEEHDQNQEKGDIEAEVADASAVDVKERIKKVASMRKKKSSKEMDAEPLNKRASYLSSRLIGIRKRQQQRQSPPSDSFSRLTRSSGAVQNAEYGHNKRKAKAQSKRAEHGKICRAQGKVNTPARIAGSATWCIARSGAGAKALQTALDYACGSGVADCAPVQPSGLCYLPNSLAAHASYAFNSYYQRSNAAPGACDFADTATVTVTDPSKILLSSSLLVVSCR